MPSIKDEYLATIPRMWCVTRQNGKSTLVVAPSEQEAVHKYNRLAKLHPELGFKEATVAQVTAVAAVK